ncbi:MAG: protein kinase, partial [Nanoarchaeota archaeon]|nr:protein kinase [Nanoarchaeota archaeon]
KGHKKIVDHFGQGNLDVALDNLMKTEAEVTAFLSDEENDNLIVRPGKYIPIAQYHGYRETGLGVVNIYSNLSGKTLSELMSEGSELNTREFIYIMRELAFAIDFVHKNGFSHNDLKPDNIFYNKRLGQVKLIDFAFAKYGDYEGSIIGKRCYTDPLRLLGNHSDSKKGDIYSFGVIMYEMLTRQMPVDFDAGMDKEEIERLVADGKLKPRDIKELRPDLDERLARITMKCLSMDLGKRYKSMDEVEYELDPGP